MRRRSCSGRLLTSTVVGLATINILLYLARTKHHALFRTTETAKEPKRDNGFDQPIFHPLPYRETRHGVSLLVRDYDDWHHSLEPMANAVGRAAAAVDVDMLVLGDHLPYPPVYSKASPPPHGVRLLPLSPEPDVPAFDYDEAIRAQWVAIVPDGALLTRPDALMSAAQEAAAQSLTGKDPTVFIAQLDAGQRPCMQSEFLVKEWTVVVRPSTTACTYSEGPAVLFLPRTALRTLEWTGLRPLSLAVQLLALARGWPVRELPKLAAAFLYQPQSRDAHTEQKHLWHEEQRRARLYDQLGIKKIDRPSGIEWHGCNKHTPRCFGTVIDDAPEYLYRDRWTPPCCQEHIRETIRYAFSRLEACGARFWLEGGTLLGALRTNDLIKWDYDADVGIFRDDIDKCAELRQAKQQGTHHASEGFVWERAREGDFYRVQYSMANHLHVDIFPFYERDGVMTKDTWMEGHPQDAEFPAHYLQPLERHLFVGLMAPVPNNARAFAELKFGPGAIEHPRLPGKADAQLGLA